MWSFCLIRLEMISLVGAAAAPPIANWRANCRAREARGRLRVPASSFLPSSVGSRSRDERVCSAVVSQFEVSPMFEFTFYTYNRATRAQLTGRSGNAG